MLLFLIVFTIEKSQSQDYQIDFAGTGSSITVDSVKIENITQCNTISINGSDILHLTSTLGIYKLQNELNNFFVLYPNPMNGNCTFSFIATRQGNATIELFDLIGKNIIQIQEVLSLGQQSYYLTGISSGLYTLKIESSDYSYKSKIISRNSTIDKPEIKHISSLVNFFDINNKKNYLENKKRGFSFLICRRGSVSLF